MRKSILVTLLVIAVLAAPGTAQAAGSATLSAGSGSGLPGASVTIPVSLSSDSGTQVSAVNFTLSFDNSRLTVASVSLGSSAAAAGKDLVSNIGVGNVRIVIVGINTNAIPDGTVANVTFNVLGGAPAGPTTLSLGSAAASDPSGDSVSLSLSNGTFTVLAPTATTAPPTATHTRTATNPPANTNTPTRTQVPAATNTTAPSASTATRTNTPGTALPTNTSAPTNTLAPGETRLPTNTPTATATLTPLAGTPNQPGGGGPKVIVAEVETAVVATSTALAQIEAYISGTETAVAAAANPASGSDPSDSSPASQPVSTSLIVAGIGVGLIVLIGGVLLIRFVRRRRVGASAEEFTSEPIQDPPPETDPTVGA